MHEHEYYQELMSRLLDEGLTAEEESALREHMRVCPECRRVGAAFTGMTAALREDLAEPPKDLVQGVMERIRDEGRTFSPRRRNSRPGGRIRPWVRLGAAACLVLIVASVATVTLRGRAKSAQPEAAGASFANTAEAQAQPAGAEDNSGQPMTASLQGGEAVYEPENGARAAAPQGEETPADSAPPPLAEPVQADAAPAPQEETALADGGAVPQEETAPADSASAPLEETTLSGDAAADDAAAAGVPAPSPTQAPLPVYDAARSRVGVIAPENIPAFESLITDGGWAEGSFEYMLKVEHLGRTYAFATDSDGGLVWWEEPSTQPLHSPGTFDQLRALITMDAAALPQ